MLTLTQAWWPLVLGQVAFVQGNAEAQSCPQPAQVEARVRQILGMRPGDQIEERATLVNDGTTLRIVVHRGDGGLLGERSLSADTTCEDLEKLASVVLASWISDVHPEFVATAPPASSDGQMPDLPGERPDDAPIEPPAAPPAHAAPPLSSARPAGPPPPSPAPPPPVATASSWRFGLGIAAGASISGSGLAPLASLQLSFMPERFGLGAALGVHGTGARSEQLSSGSVSYFRWPVELGPSLRLPLGDARLDLHAAIAVGWLRAAGNGFDPERTQNVARGGGLLSARGALGRRPFQGFLELSGVLWGKTAAFVAHDEGETEVALPTTELYVTLGMAWTL